MAEDKDKVIQQKEFNTEEAEEKEIEAEGSEQSEATVADDVEASKTGQSEDKAASQGNGVETDTVESEGEQEKYMRLLAEFQNFKKRAAKEKTDIHAYANEKLVSELLPVLDNFERALETKTEDVEGYAKGMELIFDQMKTALSNHGLKEIATQGEDFDPNKHNAVMTEESEEYESGKISKVLQKGYELNGRVIRPSMVVVTK